MVLSTHKYLDHYAPSFFVLHYGNILSLALNCPSRISQISLPNVTSCAFLRNIGQSEPRSHGFFNVDTLLAFWGLEDHTGMLHAVDECTKFVFDKSIGLLQLCFIVCSGVHTQTKRVY